MAHKRTVVALDVGEKRIGVSLADTTVRIAIAYDTLAVDGTEFQEVSRIAAYENVDVIVVGYPRNQSGEPTAQTAYVERFAAQLEGMGQQIVFQDESLTSVKAEELLRSQKKPYTKGDVDALAASLILQDYLEAQRGRI
jgi:putative Holliday junction resolvase